MNTNKYINPLHKNILNVCKNKFFYLISLKNVLGIGLGYKYTNNINTNEPCINVLVEKKLNAKYISKDNLIPQNYLGIKTDVIEIETPTIKINAKLPNKIRPLEGGFGISAKSRKGAIHSGTIGCIVTKVLNDYMSFYILSNNHVLAGSNTLPIGNPIIQPSDLHWGTEVLDTVANLSTYVPIRFQNADTSPVNYMDAALGKINKLSLVSGNIGLLGQIKGKSSVSIGDKVKKVGMISGLTEGIVTTVGTTISVQFSKGKSAFFKDIIMANLYNLSGDSGSCVLNYSNEIVGLLFAGIGDDIAIFTDINLVLNTFKVNLFNGYNILV